MDNLNSKRGRIDRMTIIEELKNNAMVTIFVGSVFLLTGIWLYLGNTEGTLWGKIGVILFTCGAMFVGIAYASMIALRQERTRS